MDSSSDLSEFLDSFDYYAPAPPIDQAANLNSPPLIDQAANRDFPPAITQRTQTSSADFTKQILRKPRVHN